MFIQNGAHAIDNRRQHVTSVTVSELSLTVIDLNDSDPGDDDVVTRQSDVFEETLSCSESNSPTTMEHSAVNEPA